MHVRCHFSRRWYCGLCWLIAGGTSLLCAAIGSAQPVFTPGLVKFEMYDLSDRDIQDLSVSVLTTHPSFPSSPARVIYLRSMDTTYAFPDPTQDQYGSRMTALFVPPTTGNWIFYLRSDDASELWFNPSGSSPAGRVKIVEETECCHLFSERASAPLALVAGQQYYIETLHREGPEYDYCQVAAKLETDSTNPDFLLPISHSHLGIIADSAGKSIVSDPARNVVAVLPTSVTNPTLLAADFTSDNGGFTVASTNAVGPWTHSPDGNGTWSAIGHLSCSSPEATTLSSPTVVVQHAGDVYVVFSHRYSFQYDGLSYDGGQLRLSINGAAYAPVPAGRFLANGYTGIVQGANALNGQEAFVATRRGHQSGYYTTSVARLGRFDVGDTLAVQFMAAWDECIHGTFPDWEIDAVRISHTVVQLNLHTAGSIAADGVPVAHTWQVDRGTGYTDLGSIEEILWLAPAGTDNGTRFRAILAIPGLAVFSEPLTLRLTREPVCQLGGPYVATCAGDRPGLAVQVDASGSSDPDGDGLSFAWSADTPGVTFEPPDSPTPTAFFGAGMTARAQCTISVTVTDDAGADVTCSTAVDTLQSTIPPSLTINGGDQSFVCDGSGANHYIELGASAIDGCGRAMDAIIGPTADTRRKGSQVVTYDAVDVFGNSAPRLTRTVFVEEPDPVLVDIPADLVAECSAPGGAMKTSPAVAAWLGTPAAEDGCDADETVVNNAPSLLPLGTTRVTWQVWDDGPTALTGSAEITVRDTLAPVVNCAPLQTPGDESGTGIVPNFADQLDASDACTAAADLNIVQTPAPGTILPLGQHSITFTVSDNAAPPHTTSCTTTLEIVRLDVGGATPSGCGAPACGSNGPLSLTATALGLFGIKLLFVTRRRK